MKVVTSSREETVGLGNRIGAAIKPGTVIGLEGQLGSGKTTFVQGIARGLNITEQVTSPTFIIIAEYEGRLPLYHMDLYRISGEDEFLALGGEDYFYGDGVCVIEWSERIRGILPENRISVRIAISRPESREFDIEGIEL